MRFYGVIYLTLSLCAPASSQEYIPYPLSSREREIIKEGSFALFNDAAAAKKSGLVRFGEILGATSKEHPSSVLICGLMKRGDAAWDVFAGVYAHAVRQYPARFALTGADKYFGSDTRKYCERYDLLPQL